jgi:outer membrane protein OmpA-like peptidoglycan-associated protein
MHARLPMPSLKVVGSWLVLALGLQFGEAGAQWTIAMRVMRNPLPVGQCSYVEIVVKDADGRQGPARPDGKQVSGWDFDFAVTSSAPDAFRLQNDDATRPFICARAPTVASATFIAHYPGRQLKPNQVVPGIELRQSVEVAMEGVPAASPPAIATAGPNPSSAAGGYPNGGYPPPGSQATGYAQPDPANPSGTNPAGAYPSGGYPQGSPGYASGNGPPSGYPSPGYPSGSPQSGGYAPGAYPQADPATSTSGYPQPSSYPQPSGYSQPSSYPQAGPTQQAQPNPVTPPTAPDAGGVRTGKQFLDRITGHAKRKASEVATNTTTHVADAAGDVVGTTLEAGSDVVKSGTGAVTGAASKQVQGVGRSLGAASSPKDPADVAAALAAGRAVLYGLRFTEGTAMLDPASGPLIGQIAGALARTPGQFLIEAHVDGKSPAAAQALSEQRAAAVKAALVAAGSSPMQLAAVGYGATRPLAGAKSSARIEIARTQ